MLRRLSRVLAALAVLAWPSPAAAISTPTVYDNYQMVPLGSRAAGMGGAYTALACDEGALHYNPASLSCSSSSHLELSANAYVLQGFRARGALGAGADISAFTYHSIPSIVGAVRVLREGSERSNVATYPKRLTFGFTVSVPATLSLKIDPPRPDERSFAAFSVRDDLTAGDLGLGYQVNREISIGVSIGAVLRTAEQHASWLLVRNLSSPCALGSCNNYLQLASDQSLLAVGARAKLGVLVRPVRHFSFGLNLTSPTIHLYGFSKQTSTSTTADERGYAAVPSRGAGSSQVGLPLRIALGGAYVRSRYTFTADVSLNFPRDIKVAYDLVPQLITGLGQPPPIPDSTIHTSWQPNLNLGAGIPFGPEKELDIGFFTDLSSVSQQDVKAGGANRVHMFGGSMTLGLLGKQSRAWIGASGEIGSTTTKVPGRGFTYEQVAMIPVGTLPAGGDATLVRWTLTGILGSNYSFLE